MAVLASPTGMNEAIRRLTVQATSKGVKETSRDLQGLGKAHQAVTVESQKSERATLSLERRLDSLQRQYDKNYRATAAMAKIERDLNAIQAQGLITAARKNELLALAAARHGAAATAATGQAGAMAALQRTTLAVASATAALTARLLTVGKEFLLWKGAYALVGGALFIKNTIEQEKAMAQLEARIKSTGGAAGFTAHELAAMAAGLQRVTTYGDESVMTAQGLLLSFTKIGRDVFPRALDAILDVATGMERDLSASTVLVGKALNDPIKGMAALSKAGITFSDSQKVVIKGLVETGRLSQAQAIILKELEARFGGSARAARDTLGGAIEGLKNAFGDMFEVPSEGSSNLIESINRLTGKLSDPATIAAVQNFGSQLFGAFSKVVEYLKENPNILPILGSAWAGAKFGGPLGAVAGAAGADVYYNQDNSVLARGSRFANRNMVWFGGSVPRGLSSPGPAPIPQELSYAGMNFTGPLGDVVNRANKADRIVASTAIAGGPTEAEIEAQKKAGEEAAKRQAQYDRSTASIEKQIAAMKIEAATIGMSAEASARYRIEQQLINSASEAGITLSESQRARIGDLAGEYSRATAQIIALREQQQTLQEVNGALSSSFSGMFSEFRDGLREGATAWESFEKAGLSALNKLADKLADMVVDQMLEAAFPTSGSGGVLGAIFGIGGGASAAVLHDGGIAGNAANKRSVHAAYFDDAPRFHSGKRPWGPGEIPAILRADEEVLTRRDPRHRWNGGVEGGGGGAINVSVLNRSSDVEASATGRQNGDGSVDIEVILDGPIAKLAARPGSALNRVLGRMGAGLPGVRR